MIEEIVYYVRRINSLGLQQSAVRTVRKIKESYLRSYWRKKAYNGTAAYTWQDITKKHVYTQSFDQFCIEQKRHQLSFLPELYKYVPDKQIVADADLFVQNCFDVLGSGMQYFTTIPWHTDFRLKAQHKKSGDLQHFDFYQFDKNIFYQDRPNLILNSNQSIDRLSKDIKVPWELSRCYHFFVLGRVYELTGEQKYADSFYAQIHDWIEHNPYLLGINWMCPMEVGLRSVNWVIASYYFFPTKQITESLYNHLIYLENNWELYDGRTSNHYLSNLIGYFYLCWFFQDLIGVEKKRDWCYSEFLREWDKQVFDEGTDYEGSTAYHRFIIEMFYHFYLLCRAFKLELPKSYQEKLMRMFQFIEWCTPYDGTLITIGDDDSGKVLFYGLGGLIPSKKYCINMSGVFSDVASEKSKYQRAKLEEVKHYQKFGLSIIKTKKWHITLRQHAYQKKQPNGHYHADVGSITVAINGMQLFIDPGSYVYTPSVYWRNYFRSYVHHNTFFLNNEPIAVDEKLFVLPISENKWRPEKNRNNLEIMCMHDLYQRRGIQMKRNVQLDKENNQLIINDFCSLQGKDTKKTDVSKTYLVYWNFVVGLEIKVEKKVKDLFFFHKNTLLAILHCAGLDFEISDAWVAPHYGTKIRTVGLRSSKDLGVEDSVTIVIEAIKKII